MNVKANSMGQFQTMCTALKNVCVSENGTTHDVTVEHGNRLTCEPATNTQNTDWNYPRLVLLRVNLSHHYNHEVISASNRTDFCKPSLNYRIQNDLMQSLNSLRSNKRCYRLLSAAASCISSTEVLMTLCG
jgi:hypothetical protein